MKRKERLQYYLAAADFWFRATELQRDRCLCRSDTFRADMNFYVVAVQRLREVARMARDRGEVMGAKTALESFDSEWPRIAEVRNLEEHALGPRGHVPFGIWYFPHAIADLQAGGKVEDIVQVEETQQSVSRLADQLKKAIEADVASLTNVQRTRPRDDSFSRSIGVVAGPLNSTLN